MDWGARRGLDAKGKMSMLQKIYLYLMCEKDDCQYRASDVNVKEDRERHRQSELISVIC